jgi:hypothetical protein
VKNLQTMIAILVCGEVELFRIKNAFSLLKISRFFLRELVPRMNTVTRAFLMEMRADEGEKQTSSRGELYADDTPLQIPHMP